MLEVIQHEQQVFVLEMFRQSLLEGRAFGFFYSERLGNGRCDKGKVPQGRERDEEDAIPEGIEKTGAGLEREPGLSRSTRTGERDKPDMRLLQEAGDRGNLALSTDEWCRLVGKIGGMRDENGLERRKSLGHQPIGRYLQHANRRGQALESHFPAVQERDSIRLSSKVDHALTGEHLTCPCQGTEPRGKIERASPVS